ncbi:MAG: acetyl-CoA carboxylase biotin carboxyl carrier protein [Bacteroidetes bacterium]|nr:acetyl-CoA carboxylase biotin carboxyl carrier protein [Bacteroidota bacterium]
MDIKQIHELVKLVNKSNIGELSIEKDNFKLTIKQKKEAAVTYAAPSAVQLPSPQPVFTPPTTLPVVDKVQPSESAKSEKIYTFKSPMIGTFYRQAGPGKPIFASVGDEIEPGKVLCIIEAMKLFNEIESEVSGTIVKVLVDDASPVEFDQPLFLVELK